MAGTSWKISGDYFETCNCDYLCPCVPSNLAGAADVTGIADAVLGIPH